MPNIFLLAGVSFIPFTKLCKLEPAEARVTILESGAVGVIAQISQNYFDMIKRIELPVQYTFLKSLSENYFNSIDYALNLKSYEQMVTS